jgi:mono/diheme cytochrome c family protein
MKSFGRFGFLIALACLLAAEARAQDSAASPDLRDGRTLALSVCAKCHVVSSDQPEPPVLQPPAPGFREIANRRGTTAKSLRAFLLTTHKTLRTPPNMPSMLLSDDEATSVATYILSLKKQP